MPVSYSDRDALLAQIAASPWESDPHLRLADLERESGDEAEGDLRERMGRWVERRMVTPWREPGLWTAPNDRAYLDPALWPAPNDRTYLDQSASHQMLDPYRHPMVSSAGSTWVVDPGPRGWLGDSIWAWMLGGPSQDQDLPPELLAGAPSVSEWYLARRSGAAPGTANIPDNVYPLMPRSEGVYADVLSPSERLAAGIDDLRGAPASLWSEVERILRQQAARGQRFSNPAGPTNYAEPAWPDGRMRIPVWSFISGSGDLDLFHVVPAARPDGSWAWEPDRLHSVRLTADMPVEGFFSHLPAMPGFDPDRYDTDRGMARAWDDHRDAHHSHNWDGRVLYPEELWMATGGQAGEPPPEIDWRPSEALPEDYYSRGAAPTGYVDPRLTPTSPHSPAYRQAHGMPRAGQYPVPPYEVVPDEEIEEQKQTVKQESQDIPGPPSGFVEVPPPGDYPTGRVGPFGDPDNPYWGVQNPEEMEAARADEPIDWDDDEFNLVDPRHRVEEIPDPDPEEIPEEGGWDDAEFTKRLVNRGIPQSGPFAQEAARRLRAATAPQRPAQARPPHWTDRGGYHPSWAPGGPRAPRRQPSGDPWAWVKNLFRRGNYARYDRDGSVQTNYSDEATVRALLQQLAAAEQAAHRWGRDDAVNGLRGIVADALDDYATNTGNPQYAREAALLRSGRHVVITPDGVRPGRFDPGPLINRFHELSGLAWERYGAAVPEVFLADEATRQQLLAEDADADLGAAIPPGYVRAFDPYPEDLFPPGAHGSDVHVSDLARWLGRVHRTNTALFGDTWDVEPDAEWGNRVQSLFDLPADAEDPDAEYAAGRDQVNYADPDRRRFSQMDPRSVSGFGTKKFVRAWIPSKDRTGRYYWQYDGSAPYDPEVHGPFESLSSDAELFNEDYLTPAWLWAMGLPGGEPPTAPEQDWRLPEATPEDFYARSGQGTAYADPSKFRLPVWVAHGYANGLTHVLPQWDPDRGWYWSQERGPIGRTTEFDTDPTWWSDLAEHVGVPFDLDRFHNDPTYLRELNDAVVEFRAGNYDFRSLTPQELWMASQGEFGQAPPGALTDELHEDAAGNQTGAFPEDFYAMSRGGRQTNYNTGDALRRQLEQTPLEITPRLELSDWHREVDDPAEADFQKDVADWIARRLESDPTYDTVGPHQFFLPIGQKNPYTIVTALNRGGRNRGWGDHYSPRLLAPAYDDDGGWVWRRAEPYDPGFAGSGLPEFDPGYVYRDPHHIAQLVGLVGPTKERAYQSWLRDEAFQLAGAEVPMADRVFSGLSGLNENRTKLWLNSGLWPYVEDIMRRQRARGIKFENEGEDGSGPTNYGLAEDLQGFTREVHQNPLELTGHLGLADFLDDNDMPRDAAFRRALADVIRTRLDTPWVDKTQATSGSGYPFDPSVRGFSPNNIPWTRVWTREPANGFWAAGWSDHEMRPRWDHNPMGPDSEPAWRWSAWGSSRREGDPVSAGQNPAAQWVPWLEGRLGGPWDHSWEQRDLATALTPGELGAFDFANLPDVDPEHWPAVEAALRGNWDRFEQFADDRAPTRYAGDRPWSKSNPGGFSDEPPGNSMWSFMGSSGMPASWPPEWRGRERWGTKIATQMVPSTGGREYDPEDPDSHPSWVYTNRGVGRVVPDQIADWMMMPQIETWGRDLNADRKWVNENGDHYFHIVAPWRDDFGLDRLLFKPLSPQDMFRTGYWDSPFRGVLNDPDDFVGRLAFADWLEEERPDLTDEWEGGWPKHEREAAERIKRRYETRGPWHLLRPIPDGYIPETIRVPDPDSFDHNKPGRKGLGSRRPYARTDYAALEPTPEPVFDFAGVLKDQNGMFRRLFWNVFEAPAVSGWGGPSWMARPHVIFRDFDGALRWAADDVAHPLRDNSEQTVADFLAARRGELWPFALPQDDISTSLVSPSDLWALGLPGGEPPPAPVDELHEGPDGLPTGPFPEDFYASEGAPMNYGEAEAEAGFRQAIAASPLDVNHHLAMADWLQDGGREADADFRQKVAAWVQRQREWRPAQAVTSLGPRWAAAAPTWDDPAAVRGGHWPGMRVFSHLPGQQRYVTWNFYPTRDNQRDLNHWYWAGHTGVSPWEGVDLTLTRSFPDRFDLAADLGYDPEAFAAARTEAQDQMLAAHGADAVARLPLSPAARALWAIDDPNLTDWDNPANRVMWDDIESMMRKRHRRGLPFAGAEEPTAYADFPTRMVADSPALPRLRKRRKSGDYRVMFEGQEEPTDYGPHAEMNSHLRAYDPEFRAGGTVDEARRAEAIYKLRAYGDLFRDEGREAHAEMIERNIGGYGDIGIWGLGLPPGFEEGQSVLRINPNGYDSWGKITPPNSYVIGMNVHAGVRPYENWRPESGLPLEEFPYYRRFHALVTDPQEAMSLIERLQAEGGGFSDDLENWEEEPYSDRVRPGVRNNWVYHLLREHAKRPPLHPNLRKYLTRNYAAGDESARTDYSLPEQRAWLERIARNWTDSNEHAVYADWLDEMGPAGDPREAAFRRALARWLQDGPVGNLSDGRPTLARPAAPPWMDFLTVEDVNDALHAVLTGGDAPEYADELPVGSEIASPKWYTWPSSQGLENSLRDQFARANPTGYDCGEYGGTMKPVPREWFLRAFN